MTTSKRSGTMQVNGAELYVEIRGSGPPFLWITGGAQDAGEAEKVAKVLADEFTVVTYDRRGLSRSPRPAGLTTTSVQEHADDAAALLEALGLAPAAIFGTSAGATIVLDLITRRPDVLRGALVHEPPIIGVLPTAAQVGEQMQALIQQGHARGGPRGALELFMRTFGGDATYEALPRDYLERVLGNAETFFQIENPAFVSYVPDIQAIVAAPTPVMPLASVENRGTFLYETTSWLAEQVDAEVVELPGGHACFIDHAAGVAAVLRPLIRSISSRVDASDQKEQTMVTTEQTREAWDNIAAGYDEFVTPMNTPLAEDALHRVGLRPGMRLLDVAAGSGAISLSAARLGAHVTAVDLAPNMVERLKARARDEGLANVKVRTMDGHALDLNDDSFDVAASQFGVMLFPNLPRGLSEMARVTKPGGRVLIVAFTDPSDQEFITFFLGAIRAAVPDFAGLPTDPPPLPFQVADPEKLRQEMARARLTDIRVERINHDMEFPSAARMWDTVTSSNPIGAMLVANLTEEQRVTAQQALDDMLRERSGGDGPAVLNNAVHIGIGTKH